MEPLSSSSVWNKPLWPVFFRFQPILNRHDHIAILRHHTGSRIEKKPVRFHHSNHIEKHNKYTLIFCTLKQTKCLHFKLRGMGCIMKWLNFTFLRFHYALYVCASLASSYYIILFYNIKQCDKDCFHFPTIKGRHCNNALQSNVRYLKKR